VKDFFGKELKVGDEVAFMCPHYRHMVAGTIVSFAPQSMLIEWVKDYGGARRDGGPNLVPNQTFRTTPAQVIKKP